MLIITMSTRPEIIKELETLGIPFRKVGVSTADLEKLLASAKVADDKLVPPAPLASENEDDGERLSAPKSKEVKGTDRLSGNDAPPGVENNDYLWRYEIDQNTGYPHFKARTVPFDPPWQYRKPSRERQKEQKARLLAEKRMTYIIPKPDGEKGDIYQSATINGYRLDIPKNEVVELPESIVELLMTSFRQTQKALNTGLYKDAKGTRI